jgi:DNA-binding XRE family transcriptional regulator
MLLRRTPCPDVKELRRLLGAAMGAEIATQAQLADLLGCTTETIKSWEKGRKKPTRPFVLRLLEIERSLKARRLSLHDEIRLGILPGDAEPRPERRAPFVASAVSVVVEGDQALVRFSLKVPGEALARTVAEVIVPRAILPSLRGDA